ncbi:MAG: hypothetical protein E7262_03920 [Lachnospiraceae bacterium]|nr:hypothetical protein [Lachnospiraceae bacterium]
MISLKVEDVKKFMNKILVDNVFDNFLTSNVEVATFSKFSIDGRINKKWYTSEELENIEDSYAKWLDIKRYVYDIIKGNKVPSSFKIVLLLSKENTSNTLKKFSYQLTENDVEGLFLNIMYENNEVNIVTGISYKTFVMDKSLDKEWDNSIKVFLNKNEVEYNEL